MSPSYPRIIPVGDSAASVEFENEIDPAVNLRVHALQKKLAEEFMDGMGEAVPSYRVLLVHYDPLRRSYAEVENHISKVLPSLTDQVVAPPRRVVIPVVYGGEYGPDLEFVARHAGLSVKDVVQIHSGVDYPVYMLGFTPGFPYLGGVDPAISTPRLESPRTHVPAGSVGIAGKQTGIYPIESPGGWRIIGRTSLRLFDPNRQPASLLAPGDLVHFVPTTQDDHHAYPSA